MTDPTPVPATQLGTPPAPRRSALVRHAAPHRLPWWRTLVVVIVAILAEVALAIVAGVWHLDAGVVATIAVAIPGCAWGQAWKSVNDPVAKAEAKADAVPVAEP